MSDRRIRESERYFDEVAERSGWNDVQSVMGIDWAFSLHLVPDISIADLGAGEGMISQLLAEHAQKYHR